MDTNDLPSDPDALAAIHANLCHLRRKYEEKVETLSEQIRAVCEARCFALYGIKEGTEVILKDGTPARVESIAFFCNLKTPPVIAVDGRTFSPEEYTVPRD